MVESQQHQHPPLSFDDSLYCQEDQFEDELTQASSFELSCFNGDHIEPHHLSPPSALADLDFCWDDDELSALLSKEEGNRLHKILHKDPCLEMARREAVDWMLRVHSHYSFSLLTALMAVNYFDRFLTSFKLHNDNKPWLTQLVAVACLSIAAKVEETHVPLLLDLQVESKYLFEAKTIQRMEILVLSTLEWKMNPVTPLSFLDYMTRRIGLKGRICWEFIRRCELVLLATISDLRFMGYLPSVLAAAAMLHVINSVEPSIEEEYQNQLLGVLGIDKDKLEECGELIIELELEGNIFLQSNKRKLVSMPGSPNGVIDVSFGSDCSNDSWAAASSSSSVCSSPEPLAKKLRVDQEQRHLDSLSILR